MLAVLTERMFAEPLMSLDWNGRQTKNLANDWRWENDGRTLSMSLRPAVTFHDGHPLTAAVAASILNQQLAERPPNYFGGLQFVERIEASDELTVRLHLTRPDSFLLTELGDINIVDKRHPDIGTGPFRLVSRDPIVVEKYPGYYRGEAGLARAEILPYDSQRSAWAAMMRGEVDMLQEAGRESVEFLRGVSDVRLHSSLRSFYISLTFNLRNPVLARVDVRRSLNEAVNRDQIISDALRGHGQVADGPIWPFHWAYNASAPRYQYNPQSASLRLDAIGLPVKQNGPADRMPSRFRFTCLFWSEQPQYERIAMLLQRQLADIGVEMDLEPLTQDALIARVGLGDFDAYLFQTNGGRTLDRTYQFWHSRKPGSGMQDTGYSAADGVLESIRATRDDPEIRREVADLQKTFFDDPPAVFLAWYQTTRAINARFELGEDPDVFAQVWRWKRSQVARAAR